MNTQQLMDTAKTLVAYSKGLNSLSCHFNLCDRNVWLSHRALCNISY